MTANSSFLLTVRPKWKRSVLSLLSVCSTRCPNCCVPLEPPHRRTFCPASSHPQAVTSPSPRAGTEAAPLGEVTLRSAVSPALFFEGNVSLECFGLLLHRQLPRTLASAALWPKTVHTEQGQVARGSRPPQPHGVASSCAPGSLVSAGSGERSDVAHELLQRRWFCVGWNGTQMKTPNFLPSNHNDCSWYTAAWFGSLAD